MLIIRLSARLRAACAIVAVLALSGVAHAGTTALFGYGCGGDFVNPTGTLPTVLTDSASAACTIGGGTTGSSSESGLAGPGVLGATVETLHNGSGSGFQSLMQATFSDTVVFTSPTNDPIVVQLRVVVKGLLTADAGTGYNVDLNSSTFGHIAGYSFSCNCGIGFPPLDGVAHILTSAPVSVLPNTPVPIDLTLEADVGAGGSPSHIALDLANGVTLNPTAVFVVPAGVTVNSPGLNIVNNQWASPSPGGSVTYSNTTLTSLPPLPSVIAGDLTITNNLDLTLVDASSVTSVGGSVNIGGNGGAAVILTSSKVGGNATISTPTGTVNIGSATVTGNLVVTTGSSAALDLSSASVGGNTTITTTGSPGVTATTGGGTTTVSMTNGVATMTVELPVNSFAVPVAYTVAPVDPAAMPGSGVAAGGAVALTTLAAYQFTFAVPTLNAAATLDFDVPLAGLSAAVQSDVLAALAAGRVTLATLGDAPGSVYQSFPVCPAGTPAALDGCVEVILIDGAGQPLPPGTQDVPAIITFSGVVGHFSRWGVVITKDAQPPVITGVPASFSVLTAATSTVVTFATPTATDAIDGPVAVTCVPASGSSVPVGATPVTCTAKDTAGNTATAGFTVTVVRDAAPPSISIGTPGANATYAPGAAVKAAYTCTDALSAVALCAGPVAAGQNIDTAAAGPHTFTVNAQDSLGNATSATVSYTITAPVAGPGPDLVVAALTLSTARIQRGHDVRVDVATRNQGTARSRDSSTRFYLAAGPVRTSQSPLLHQRQVVPSLAPGAAARWTETIEIYGTTPPGSYYLVACADDLGEVAESDETNNCTALTTPIQVTR